MAKKVLSNVPTKKEDEDSWSVTSRVVGPMFKSFPKPTKKGKGKK